MFSVWTVDDFRLNAPNSKWSFRYVPARSGLHGCTKITHGNIFIVILSCIANGIVIAAVGTKEFPVYGSIEWSLHNCNSMWNESQAGPLQMLDDARDGVIGRWLRAIIWWSSNMRRRMISSRKSWVIRIEAGKCNWFYEYIIISFFKKFLRLDYPFHSRLWREIGLLSFSNVVRFFWDFFRREMFKMSLFTAFWLHFVQWLIGSEVLWNAFDWTSSFCNENSH